MPVFVDNAIAQFENVNSLRGYPFERADSLVDRCGRSLSQDVIVEVHMAVPATGSQIPRVKLSSVHLSPAMVSACFKSEFEGKTRALAVTVAAGNFRPYMPYMLDRLYGSEDIGGVVTVGDRDFPGFPETYFFDDAVVHSCCVAAAKPAGLRSIVDRRTGEMLSGDVRMSFSSHIVSNKDGKMFSLSLEDGSANELASECVGGTSAGICGATPIKSINGVAPDKEGNIVLWFH